MISLEACDQLATPTVDSSWEAMAIRGAFRKAMLEGKIETDAYTNVGGTIQHANLILAAPSSAGLTVYVDGTKLVSIEEPSERMRVAGIRGIRSQSVADPGRVRTGILGPTYSAPVDRHRL